MQCYQRTCASKNHGKPRANDGEVILSVAAAWAYQAGGGSARGQSRAKDVVTNGEDPEGVCEMISIWKISLSILQRFPVVSRFRDASNLSQCIERWKRGLPRPLVPRVLHTHVRIYLILSLSHKHVHLQTSLFPRKKHLLA